MLREERSYERPSHFQPKQKEEWSGYALSWGRLLWKHFFFPIQDKQLDARGGSSGRPHLRYIDSRIIDINVVFKATSLLGTAYHWRAEGMRAEDAGLGHPNRMPLA